MWVPIASDSRTSRVLVRDLSGTNTRLRICRGYDRCGGDRSVGQSKSPIRFVCWALFFFLLTPFSLAQETKTSPQDLERSCRNFVQRFYDWYVPKALGEIESKEPASDLALKYKSSAFSSELARALGELGNPIQVFFSLDSHRKLPNTTPTPTATAPPAAS